MTKEWIAFAQIGRPHGLKGAFFLKTSDNRTTWEGYPEVLHQETGRKYKVTNHYTTGNALVIMLEGLDSRNAIEPLYLQTLSVHRQNIAAPAADEYLIADLVGMSVNAANKPNLGIVVAVGNYGAQEILEIQLTGSKETVLYPFMDKYIHEVNSANKTITIEYIADFFESKKSEPRGPSSK